MSQARPGGYEGMEGIMYTIKCGGRTSTARTMKEAKQIAASMRWRLGGEPVITGEDSPAQPIDWTRHLTRRGFQPQPHLTKVNWEDRDAEREYARDFI